MIAAACLALLAGAPDAALACIFHNPDLEPIVLGDTGTPKAHASSMICRVTADGGRFCTIPPVSVDDECTPVGVTCEGYLPSATCYGEVRWLDGVPTYVEWCVWQ